LCVLLEAARELCFSLCNPAIELGDEFVWHFVFVAANDAATNEAVYAFVELCHLVHFLHKSFVVASFVLYKMWSFFYDLLLHVYTKAQLTFHAAKLQMFLQKIKVFSADGNSEKSCNFCDCLIDV